MGISSFSSPWGPAEATTSPMQLWETPERSVCMFMLLPEVAGITSPAPKQMLSDIPLKCLLWKMQGIGGINSWCRQLRRLFHAKNNYKESEGKKSSKLFPIFSNLLSSNLEEVSCFLLYSRCHFPPSERLSPGVLSMLQSQGSEPFIPWE